MRSCSVMSLSLSLSVLGKGDLVDFCSETECGVRLRPAAPLALGVPVPVPDVVCDMGGLFVCRLSTVSISRQIITTLFQRV